MTATREELKRVRSGDVVTAYYACGATLTSPVRADGARLVFAGALGNFEVIGADGLLASGIVGLRVGSQGSTHAVLGRRPTAQEIEPASGLSGACPAV